MPKMSIQKPNTRERQKYKTKWDNMSRSQKGLYSDFEAYYRARRTTALKGRTFKPTHRYGFSGVGLPKIVYIIINGKVRKGLDPGSAYRYGVRIKYQGSRTADFALADQLLINAKHPPRSANEVWHHFHNVTCVGSAAYGTLYLMRKSIHGATRYKHYGGVSQYCALTGNWYN